MKKFIKIIDDSEYEKHLNYKYIPKKLLYAFQKQIKPRIICNYISLSDTQTLGYGVGLLLKTGMVAKEEYKNILIDAIVEIKAEEEYSDIEYLIDSNLELDYEDLKYIEDQCNVQVPSGKKEFARNVISCIREICIIKKDEIAQKEVFIISDDTNITNTLVEELSAIVKFIAVFTEDDEFGQCLEKDMFNKYGLSLHITNKKNKIYNNFDFIINLNEELTLCISDICAGKVIMDLSDSKVLIRDKSNKNIKSIIIEDLFFENNEIISNKGGEYEFGEFLNTSQYALLKKSKPEIVKVKIKDKLSSIEEVLSRIDFKNQSNSQFNKC